MDNSDHKFMEQHMLSVLIYKLKDLKTKKRSFHNERLLEIAFEVGKIVQWDIGTITDQSVVSENFADFP